MNRRKHYAKVAVAFLEKKHGGAYAVIDFGAGPIEIIQGDGEDLTEAAARDLAGFRLGYRLTGADV